MGTPYNKESKALYLKKSSFVQGKQEQPPWWLSTWTKKLPDSSVLLNQEVPYTHGPHPPCLAGVFPLSWFFSNLQQNTNMPWLCRTTSTVERRAVPGITVMTESGGTRLVTKHAAILNPEEIFLSLWQSRHFLLVSHMPALSFAIHHLGVGVRVRKWREWCQTCKEFSMADSQMWGPASLKKSV